MRAPDVPQPREPEQIAVVDKVVPFADAGSAFAAMAAGEHFAKIVLQF